MESELKKWAAKITRVEIPGWGKKKNVRRKGGMKSPENSPEKVLASSGAERKTVEVAEIGKGGGGKKKKKAFMVVTGWSRENSAGETGVEEAKGGEKGDPGFCGQQKKKGYALGCVMGGARVGTLRLQKKRGGGTPDCPPRGGGILKRERPLSRRVPEGIRKEEREEFGFCVRPREREGRLDNRGTAA